MRIFEFTGGDPLLIKLVATVSQLKSNIDNGQEHPDWTVDELLSYLKDNEIIIDQDDLYDMVKHPPLKNIISNIQGNDIIFKGQASETPQDQDADQSKNIVKSMAHNAQK